MKIRIFQKGFNYSQDGQGNRLVYHLQGCNLHCPWCANPEGLSIEPVMMTIAGATKASSRDYEIDEIVAEAKSCIPMFFDGGGVTLTGGEPTLQFEAVRELFSRLSEAGIHTALETNGTNPRLPELLPLIDQLIMDFKHYDSEVHRAFTGVSNEIIMANILQAEKVGKDLLLRIPLINGFNAGLEDIKGFAGFFKEVNRPGLSVELLFYHEYGKEKWAQCGLDYKMADGYVSKERFAAFEKGLSDAGVNLVRT